MRITLYDGARTIGGSKIHVSEGGGTASSWTSG